MEFKTFSKRAMNDRFEPSAPPSEDPPPAYEDIASFQFNES